MNKTEGRVKINKQNKAEKTNKICHHYKLFLPLSISDFSKNCNHRQKGLSQQPPQKIEILPSTHIFENLVGGSNLMSMYIMSDGKNKLLLHCYTNIKR